MRVFLTGSSSHFAQALLPRLCAHPQVECVTGIDVAPPHSSHAKFRAQVLDIRDARIARAMAGHDVLVHLAFVVLRGRMPEAEMRSVNIEGAQHAFRAARAAGVTRFVHLSSAAVYGSGERLTEDAPLAPLPGFLYGEHKAGLERWLAAEFPECARLRPHVILGPHAQPLLARLLAQPCCLRLPDPQPRLQCVHGEDVADAVMLAITRAARGPFNLAAADSFSFRDELRWRHKVIVPLPPRLARLALAAVWRLTGWGGEPAWIDGLARTLTLDCARARSELGWRPRWTGGETLALT